MYGKCFASMYEGSMLGAGPEVFALWPYIIANCDRTGYVELNVDLVALKIGMPVMGVQSVLKRFCEPDPKSRSKEKQGRKLVKVGEYLYQVVNYEKYRAIKSADDRRESNRAAQARFRAKKNGKPVGHLPDGSTAARLAETHGDEAAEALMARHEEELDEVRRETNGR